MTTKTNKEKAPIKRTNPGSEDRAAISKIVLDGMRSGLSALKSCKAAGVPQSTFNGWLNDDSELAAEYARAREDLIEKMANDLLEIADEPVAINAAGSTDSGAVQKQRLQVDTRKWLLSKLAPKKYGDKLELSGDKENPLELSVTAALDVTKLSDSSLAEIISARMDSNNV